MKKIKNKEKKRRIHIFTRFNLHDKLAEYETITYVLTKTYNLKIICLRVNPVKN